METASIILTGAIILVSVIWFYQKTKVILHPFVFVGVICFLVQVVGPMSWKTAGIRDYRGIPIMDYIIPAEMIFIIGYCFYWLSYRYVYVKHQPPAGIPVYNDGYSDIDIDIQAAYFIYGASFILYCGYLFIKGRSLLSQLTLGQRGLYSEDISSETSLNFLAISINMMITVTCILLFLSKRYVRYLLYLITLLLTITSGRRHLMLDIVLAPLLIYYTKKKKQPNVVVLSVAAVISFLLVGWIGAMRSVYRYGVGSLTAYDSEKAWDAVMINLEVFMPLCMYIPNLRSLNAFSLGSSYIIAVIQLIPSILFPFKNKIISAISLGNYRTVLGSKLLAEGIAGTYWSLLYANGWVIGVIIGMILLGCWIKKIDKKLEFGRFSYIVEYSILTTFMFQFLTRSFGNAIQDLLGLILPIMILRRIRFRKTETV